MAAIKLKYVHIYKDCRGKKRCYFNKRGRLKVALPLPNNPNFLNAYNNALADKGNTKQSKRALAHTGRLESVIQSYYGSLDWKNLSTSTQRTYRPIIERLRVSFGHIPLDELTTDRVNAIRNTKIDFPTAANRILSIMSILFGHAINRGMIITNPVIGLQKVKVKKRGFPTWEEDHIAQYREQWPLGTPQHLALQLLLQTGQRRGDVIGMSFEQIENHSLTIKQNKTGAIVTIPLLPDLRVALEQLPYQTGIILKTSFHKPFTAAGFGNWFRSACDKANLFGLSAHGLRKAMCTRLADAGCTPHEIMAVSGHLTIKEVTIYTVEANKKKLAQKATAKLLYEA